MKSIFSVFFSLAVAVFVHNRGHSAALLLPLHILLALPGGAAHLPHDQRSARHQLRTNEVLLPDWLGGACLHHRSETIYVCFLNLTVIKII